MRHQILPQEEVRALFRQLTQVCSAADINRHLQFAKNYQIWKIPPLSRFSDQPFAQRQARRRGQDAARCPTTMHAEVISPWVFDG